MSVSEEVKKMPIADEIVYSRGELSIIQIEAEIAQFQQELGTSNSPMVDSELQAAGLDRAALANVDLRNAITVRAGNSGADPTAVLIIVSLAPSANRVVKDLWATVLLPRIRRRWGDDAVGEEKRDQG
jgi:hypothetical protein